MGIGGVLFVSGEDFLLVAGLDMIPQRTPAVISGFFDDPGPHGIQIDVDQAVDQRLAFFHDHAFKPIAPEIAPAAMTLSPQVKTPTSPMFPKLVQLVNNVPEIVQFSRDSLLGYKAPDTQLFQSQLRSNGIQH